MDNNTMQLIVIADVESGEPELNEPLHQRWHLFTPRRPKKHRIQDRNAQLQRDLRVSQALNEELSDALDDALRRNMALEDKLAELTERLRVSESANHANEHAIDFYFPLRPVDDPEDQATMPVPMAQLLSEPETRNVDAATALLDRVVPKIVKAIEPPPASGTAANGSVTEDSRGLTDENDDEVYDATVTGWQLRRPEPRRAVTWGVPVPQQRVVRADVSSTGTFRVTPLHQRGTGPTAIPGIDV